MMGFLEYFLDPRFNMHLIADKPTMVSVPIASTLHHSSAVFVHATGAPAIFSPVDNDPGPGSLVPSDLPQLPALQ